MYVDAFAIDVDDYIVPCGNSVPGFLQSLLLCMALHRARFISGKSRKMRQEMLHGLDAFRARCILNMHISVHIMVLL